MEISAFQWAVLGLILIILEIAMGQFYVLFFGAAALFVALVKFFGVDNILIETALFSIFGLLGIFPIRKKLLSMKTAAGSVEPDLLQKFVLSVDLPARTQGTIQYQGSPWTAENISDYDLLRGSMVQIIEMDSIKLKIKESK